MSSTPPPYPGDAAAEAAAAAAEASATAAAASATAAAASAATVNTQLAIFFQPGVTNTTFTAIQDLKVFGPGVDRTKKYFLKYFLFRDTGTRCLITVSHVDYDGVSNPVDVCSYNLGSGAAFTGLTPLFLSPILITGTTGYGVYAEIVVDFGSGAGISNPTGTWATAGLTETVLIPSQADTEYRTGQAAAAYPYSLFVTPSPTDASITVATITTYMEWVQLYGVSDYTKKYFLRVFNYHDVGTTRFLINVSQVDSDGVSNQVDVCSFSVSSGASYLGLNGFSLSALNSSGITGYMVVNFGATAPTFSIANGSTPVGYAISGFSPQVIFDNPALTAHLTVEINAALAAGAVTVGSKTPFIDTLNNDTLRKQVKGLWLYNVSKADQWYVSHLFASYGTNRPFCGVQITRVSDGTVLSWAVSGALSTTLGTGNGTNLSFPGTLASTPVNTSSVVIIVTTGGVNVQVGADNGTGNITGATVSGTINYSTGAVTLTFTAGNAPASGATVLSQYSTANLLASEMPTQFWVQWRAPAGESATLYDPGIFGVIQMDWTQIPTGTSVTYTTYAQSGIFAGCLYTPDDVEALNKLKSANTIVRVGPGLDYTDLGAALTALNRAPPIAGTALSSVSFYSNICDLAHPASWVEVQIITPTATSATLFGRQYDIAYSVATGANILPGYCKLKGGGSQRTLIQPLGTPTDHIFQVNRDNGVEGVTFFSPGGNSATDLFYPIHCDPQRYGQPDSLLPRIEFEFEDVVALCSDQTTRPGIGSGVFGGSRLHINGGTSILFNSVSAEADLFHSTPATGSANPNLRPALVKIRDHMGNGPLLLQSLAALHKNQIDINNGTFYTRIDMQNLDDVYDIAQERQEWELTGSMVLPVNTFDPGMVVLATTVGATVAGTAAPIIFGSLDDLGRGLKCIRPQPSDTSLTDYPTASLPYNPTSGFLDTSLATRLGNLTTGSLTLSTGGSLATLNQNYTGMTTAAIITSINAALASAGGGNAPLYAANVSFENFPAVSGGMQMLNGSGSQIGDPTLTGPGHGVFVKLTAPRTVATADDGDTVIGFAPRPIPVGKMGVIITLKTFFCAVMAGGYTFSNGSTANGTNFLPSATGPFGVGTGGILSFGAVNKIGIMDAAGIGKLT